MSASFSDFVDLDDVTLTPSFETSAPRMVAIINGTSYEVIDASVELVAHGFSNEAECTLAIVGNPDFSIILGDASSDTSSTITTNASGAPSSISLNSSDLSNAETTSNPSVYFELWAGLFESPQYGSLDTTGMVRLFLGVIESYDAPFNEGAVTFQLRSIAADLADTKITRLTIGEVVSSTFLQEQATAAGLLAVGPNQPIANPVTVQQLLGREFIGGAAFAATVYRKSAADLLIQGASFDDADVWLEDDTIYYQQARYVNRGTPISLVHGRDFALQDGIIGSHALRQSNNVQVDVHSFNIRTRVATRTRITVDPVTLAATKITSSQTISKSIPLYGTNSTLSQTTGPTGTTFSEATSTGGSVTSRSGLASGPSNVEKYSYYVPNQSPETCNTLATAIARQIASLEYRLVFTFPMKIELVSQVKIRSEFKISGLPYDRFNATYWPRKITHKLSLSEGWKCTVEAVNHAILSGELS